MAGSTSPLRTLLMECLRDPALKKCSFVQYMQLKSAAFDTTHDIARTQQAPHPLALVEEALDPYALRDPAFLGKGVRTLALAATCADERVALRLSTSREYRVDSRHLLPITHEGDVGYGLHTHFEIQPKATICGETGFDFLHHPIENGIYAQLLMYAEGRFFWEEPRGDNVGIYKGKIVIIDPGAMKDESPYARDDIMNFMHEFYDMLLADPMRDALRQSRPCLQLFSRFAAAVAPAQAGLLHARAQQHGLMCAETRRGGHMVFMFDPEQRMSGLDVAHALGFTGIAPASAARPDAYPS